MKDSYGREIDYMRISITDRCNLRCRYCMPEGITLMPMRDILTYEEIREVVSAAVNLGITRFRITGGEPLVRKGAAELVRMIHDTAGVTRVSMTTNGILLGPMVRELMAAGLTSVNVSLDTLDPAVFREITGFDRLADVLSGIDQAYDAGLKVKINCVPQKGISYASWKQLIDMAKTRAIDVRFIEMMPIGYGKRYQTVSNEEILSAIRLSCPDIRKDPARHGDGPAVYYRIPGYEGSVGFISAIHGKFCGSCNRIRLTAQGGLKLCLCYGDSVDLRKILRSYSGEELQRELIKAIRRGILEKPGEHHFGESGGVTEDKLMTQIGG